MITPGAKRPRYGGNDCYNNDDNVVVCDVEADFPNTNMLFVSDHIKGRWIFMGKGYGLTVLTAF